MLRARLGYCTTLSSTLPLFAAVCIVVGCEEPIDFNSAYKVTSADAPRAHNIASSADASEIPSFPSDPSAFVSEITNPHLSFERGKIFQYEGETEDGIETIIVEVTSRNKRILGIATTVVHDQAFLDGDLIEDTFDWFAQDRDGNVWYFGEDSKEIEDGIVVSTEGSWEAGVNGARPGLIMLANPQNGMKYQQEFAEDVAEDMAQVVNIDKTIEIGLGTFEGCLETMEFTPLEPGHREHKYYYPGTGLILEVSPRGGQLELVSVTN